MPIDFSARQLAARAAAVEACLTADLAARSLDCSPDAARTALKLLTDSGYFRPLLAVGLGNKICFQPTPKAANLHGPNIPKFLRAGLANSARLRGLLRGFARFAARPDLSFLTISEQATLHEKYCIPTGGHARALVGLNGAHYHIFVPVLAADQPAAAITAAADRWLPLLESGSATLHFAAQAASAAGLRAALAMLAPAGVSASDDLARLDAEIAADRTGLVALRQAARRAALAAEAAAEPASEYTWLGDVVEAQL